ncbi:MAG TPA: lipocalin-like domain-containing protein [Balneolales bacterium]|nr:lipocalin-like domain-containing protein [Balneolales bacterium]
MRYKYTWIFLAVITVVIIYWIFFHSSVTGNQSNPSSGVSLSDVLGNTDTIGFKRAVKPGNFVFPADYGPHPDFKTEWWYYTGNLDTRDGRHFGYELTFFRIAASPDSVRSQSDWATNQFYMAHFTVTDVRNRKFYDYQRFSRAALQLAGAQANPYNVWLYDWRVMGGDKHADTVYVQAADSGISIDLKLLASKPPVLEGNHGLSQKGTRPGNASYYFSVPRLHTQGTVGIHGQKYSVIGNSWMDREWSTSMLEEDLSGWDWFSLQLDNGWDLMYYQLRKIDGQPASTSDGSLIDPQGKKTNLPFGTVQLVTTGTWRSPTDDATYPSGWKLTIPKKKTDLVITPYIPNQELTTSVRYWEGCVQIKGIMNGKQVDGSGYVELTGYAAGPKTVELNR